jgi:hypothetical protein
LIISSKQQRAFPLALISRTTSTVGTTKPAPMIQVLLLFRCQSSFPLLPLLSEQNGDKSGHDYTPSLKKKKTALLHRFTENLHERKPTRFTARYQMGKHAKQKGAERKEKEKKTTEIIITTK